MKKLVYLSLLTFALSACKKEKNQPLLDGTYSGTFKTWVNNKEQVSDFEVTLNAQRFTTTKGGAGRGSFKIINSDNIKFADELFYTANFDWNTLLSGDYLYRVNGDSLILDKVFMQSARDPSQYYQYRLKRINTP
jgi:hypothetical protein